MVSESICDFRVHFLKFNLDQILVDDKSVILTEVIWYDFTLSLGINLSFLRPSLRALLPCLRAPKTFGTKNFSIFFLPITSGSNIFLPTLLPLFTHTHKWSKTTSPYLFFPVYIPWNSWEKVEINDLKPWVFVVGNLFGSEHAVVGHWKCLHI